MVIMLRAVDSSSSNQFLPFFFFFFWLFKKRLLLPERSFLINSSFFISNVSLSLDFDRSLLATNYPKDIPISHYDNISIVHPFSPSYISTKYISDSHRLTIEFELVCNASFPPSKPSKIFQIYVSALYKAPIDCPIHARVSFLLPKNSRFTCPHRLLQEMIDRPTESPLPFSNSLKNSTEISIFSLKSRERTNPNQTCSKKTF